MLKKIIGILLVLTVVVTMLVGCGAGKYDLDPEKVIDKKMVGANIGMLQDEFLISGTPESSYKKSIDFLGYTGEITYHITDNTIDWVSYWAPVEVDSETCVNMFFDVKKELESKYGQPITTDVAFSDNPDISKERILKDAKEALEQNGSLAVQVLWDKIELSLYVGNMSGCEIALAYYA